MPINSLLKKVFFTTGFFFILTYLSAQSCSGSLGDPIVNITFGSGDNFGPPLAAGTTSALQYQAATCPDDGHYSIVNYTSGCWPYDVVWHTATDHTGGGTGYFILINASYQPSDFYIQTIDGLCAGTSYQFAAWIINMCSVTGNLPNITFTIEKTDGTILATYKTNDIPIVNPATWNQYGFFFTTPVGISSVLLRMRNNAPGGVGNDLGLDDITFKPAGPQLTTTISGNVNNSISICEADTTSFVLSTEIENCYSSPAYQWQLSMDSGKIYKNIVSATTTTYRRLATMPGYFLYRLLVAESVNINVPTCRVTSAPVIIQVHPKPVIVVKNNSPLCEGAPIILTVTTGSSYQWNGAYNFTSSGKNDTIKNSTVANSGKYYVSVTNKEGCVKMDSTLVVINPKPSAKFTITAPLCENNLINFTDQSSAPAGAIKLWNWNFGDDSITVVASPSHIFTHAASYVVSLSVQNLSGCISDTIHQKIVINPLPKANFLLPSFCLSDINAYFLNSTIFNGAGETDYTCLWNFGDANATPANLNSSLQKSPKHGYTSVGIYPVHLKVTDNAGCFYDTLKNFTVNGAVSHAAFIIDSLYSFCSNIAINIIDSSSVNFGAIFKTAIYWDYLNEPTNMITDSFPVRGKKYVHKYTDFGMPSTKLTTIKLVASAGVSCIDESAQVIILKNVPAVHFNSLKNRCEGDSPFMFTEATEINGLIGKGIYSGSGINSNGLFTAATAAAGKNIIRYTFTANNNCIAFAEEPIMVFKQPIINAGPDRALFLGDTIILNATAYGNNLKYNWEPNISIENNTLLTPKANPFQNMVYTLMVLSAEGCIATDEVKVTVLKDIFIPDAFSPNGDGLNDTWVIPYLNYAEGSTVQVYNRFGQIVYVASVNSKGWDGTYKGSALPGGTYVWILNTGKLKKILKGTVTILR